MSILTNILNFFSKKKTYTDEQGVEYGNNGKLLKKVPPELVEYTIPASVVEIENYAFESCSKLQSIKVDINNKNYCADNDVLFNKDKTILIRCSTKHKECSIPYSVIKIGCGAFEDCCSLYSINIPNSVKEIGWFAFWGCRSLQSINIPYSVTDIGRWTFYGCSCLQNINIPDSVTKIGEHAFDDCSSLQRINIHYHVTEIGDWAFASCSSLQSINIPNSVTGIGEYAFEDCSSLQRINVDINNKNYCADNDVLFNKNKTILIKCSTKHKEYVIPESVTEIEGDAFYGCSSLQSINIPNSVTEIGEDAFYDCSSLTSIIIPKGTRKKFEELIYDDLHEIIKEE